MEHKCENCNKSFKIERHTRVYKDNKICILCGTGHNMVYKGDMNREYAICPFCETVESQLSAEARDQQEEAK